MPVRILVGELENLERWKQRQPRGNSRTKAELAEIHLLRFRDEFVRRYERERMAVLRAMRESVARNRYDRTYTLPRLLINDDSTFSCITFASALVDPGYSNSSNFTNFTA